MEGTLLEARTPGADNARLESEIEHTLEELNDRGSRVGVQLIKAADVSGDADAVLGAQAASVNNVTTTS